MSNAALSIQKGPGGRGLFVTVGAGLFVTAAFLWTQSALVFLFVPAAWLAWFVLKSPVRSLTAFLLINVVLTIRPKADTLDGAPTVIDLILGLCLALIIGYWTLRIRLILNQPLAASRSQLLLHIFFGWAAVVSVAGLLFLNTPIAVMLRELLNLLPLVIVPVLYERYIESHSRHENRVVWLTIASGVVVMLWNIVYFRNHLAKAFYVFQTGRAAFDLALVCLIILAMTSYLMIAKKGWSVVAASSLLLLGWLALIISFTRTLWLAAFLGSAFVVWYGSSQERRNGIRRSMAVAALVIASLVPVFLTNRTVHLLVLNYGVRLVSTTHATTDRSLMARVSEWHGELARIMESPIVGNGFGASFRFFDVLTYAHQWYPFSHNSYLFILFKTGLIGGILFFGALMGFVLKGFRLLREPMLDARARMLLRAVMASILVQLFGAFTGPTFCSKTPMVWLGLCWGFLLATEKRLGREDSHSLT